MFWSSMQAAVSFHTWQRPLSCQVASLEQGFFLGFACFASDQVQLLKPPIEAAVA